MSDLARDVARELVVRELEREVAAFREWDDILHAMFDNADTVTIADLIFARESSNASFKRIEGLERMLRESLTTS